jgi:hypothetical protein
VHSQKPAIIYPFLNRSVLKGTTLKVALIALLAALALSSIGCDELAPPPQNAAQATQSYQGRLAEICSDKHKENLPPDEFNHIAKTFYHDIDINAQQTVDKSVTRSCAASGATQPGCYNDGFLSSIQSVGEMDHFALTVCSEGGGNAHEGSGL